jgi:hypothetical protein
MQAYAETSVAFSEAFTAKSPTYRDALVVADAAWLAIEAHIAEHERGVLPARNT